MSDPFKFQSTVLGLFHSVENYEIFPLREPDVIPRLPPGFQEELLHEELEALG